MYRLYAIFALGGNPQKFLADLFVYIMKGLINMGMFFGYTGSLLILSAAAGVILRFCTEVKLLAKDTVLNIIKSFLLSTAAGLIYLAFIAYIKTCFSEVVNMFDFAALFPDTEIREGLLGKLVFGEYAAAAGAVSFIGAGVFMYILLTILKRFLGNQSSWEAAIFAVFLPGFFMLYSPSYISLICAAAAFILWLIARRINISPKELIIPAPVKITVFSAELIISAFCIYSFVIS